jgi:hypothetical protein
LDRGVLVPDAKEWLERVKTWMSNEEEGSEMLIDNVWELEVTDESIMGTAEDIPYSIQIDVSEEFINILVHTGLETATMANDERLDLYRKLLILNDETQMMKLVLNGRNDEIVIRTDLDLASLGKEEFNDAIISVLVGADGLHSILGSTGDEEEEEDAEEAINAIVAALRFKSRDQVVDMLINQVGMDREDAIKLVDRIIKAYQIRPPSPTGYA